MHLYFTYVNIYILNILWMYKIIINLFKFIYKIYTRVSHGTLLVWYFLTSMLQIGAEQRVAIFSDDTKLFRVIKSNRVLKNSKSISPNCVHRLQDSKCNFRLARIRCTSCQINQSINQYKVQLHLCMSFEVAVI